MILACHNLSKSFGDQVIVKDGSFHIENHEKAALVGLNGAGKSTILKMIVGQLSPDAGTVVLTKGKTLGYLAQHQEMESGNTIYEEVRTAKAEVIEMEKQIRTIEIELPSLSGDALEARLATYQRLTSAFEHADGYAYKSELTGVLKGLGFTEEEFTKPVDSLSGGQKTRVSLGKLLLTKPDVLLLDEPTNHLDIASVEWLEEYLVSYEKAIIMVSHDRFFIDRTAEIIYELSDGKLMRYVGNYTEYKKQKEKQRVSQQKKYDAQQKEIARLNELIEKFKHKPKKASMARSKKKVLERMQKVEKPDKEEAYIFKEKLEPLMPGAKNVLETEHLKIGYKNPIRELTLRIRRGQKIAVLGANGAGKTTFFKTIIGQLQPISGKYIIGNGIATGYFDQHSGEIQSEKRVEEHFGECFPKLTEKEKRQILGRYLFSSQKANVKISDLSGGEKSRLILAEILESRPNFLVLDEPTNHMDLPAKETMESAFSAYTGTMLFISHDRYFVSKIADALLLFEEDGVKYYPFNYEHYLHMLKKKREGDQNWADVVEAENTALVEGLLSVPAKERHQSARFNTEQSYTDWQLTLAREQLEKCQKNIEYWQKQAATELDNLTFEQYQSEKWTKRQRELHKRFEELSEEYLQQNLIWYEKYQEYEEAFSDYLE